MPSLIQQIKRDLEAAEILSSFGVRYIEPSRDSISGAIREAYLIFDGNPSRLTGLHFSNLELAQLAVELDLAMGTILRDRARLRLAVINEATTAPPPPAQTANIIPVHEQTR